MKKTKGSDAEFDAQTPDYWVFHAPYNKLVQKSFGRLVFMDARRRLEANGAESDQLKDWLTTPLEETYSDKSLEKVLKTVSADIFQQKFTDANAASKIVGNTYTASVYLGLASLIDRTKEELSPGKTIGLFSYGSGALATMYCLSA